MTDPLLEPLGRLVGTWTTEASHPAMPGLTVHGGSTVEWLAGEKFLILRSWTDHPDFPDSLSVIGLTDRDRVGAEELPAGSTGPKLSMQYFDSRGVFRIYQVELDDEHWRWWRHAPGFSQRFVGTFTDRGDVIVGRSEASEDGTTWNADLQITYRRAR